MAYNDTIAKNIRKQIALNAGPMVIASQNVQGSGITTGALQWVDGNTRNPIANSGNAGSWLTQNTPQTVTARISADVYNYVQGVFQKLGVPDSVVQPLVSAASYYIAQTGSDPQKLYNTTTGKLDAGFVTVYNSLRHPGSQIGVVQTNSSPNWQNNVLLRGNLQEFLP